MTAIKKINGDNKTRPQKAATKSMIRINFIYKGGLVQFFGLVVKFSAGQLIRKSQRIKDLPKDWNTYAQMLFYSDSYLPY